MDWGGPRVRRPAIKALFLASYLIVGQSAQFGNSPYSAEQNKRHRRSPSGAVGKTTQAPRCKKMRDRTSDLQVSRPMPYQLSQYGVLFHASYRLPTATPIVTFEFHMSQLHFNTHAHGAHFRQRCVLAGTTAANAHAHIWSCLIGAGLRSP